MNEKYVKERMTDIMIHYIYIDRDNSIEKIVNEKENLIEDGDDSILPGNRSIQLIQNHLVCDKKKKYKLSESLLYNVDIEFINLQSYNKDNNSISFLNALPFFNVIRILPSLSIFHSLNCIFMIFKEVNERYYQTKRLIFRKDIKQTQKNRSKKMNEIDKE